MTHDKYLTIYSSIILGFSILFAGAKINEITKEESKLIKKVSAEEKEMLNKISTKRFYEQPKLFNEQKTKYLCYK